MTRNIPAMCQRSCVPLLRTLSPFAKSIKRVEEDKVDFLHSSVCSTRITLRWLTAADTRL